MRSSFIKSAILGLLCLSLTQCASSDEVDEGNELENEFNEEQEEVANFQGEDGEQGFNEEFADSEDINNAEDNEFAQEEDGEGFNNAVDDEFGLNNQGNNQLAFQNQGNLGQNNLNIGQEYLNQGNQLVDGNLQQNGELLEASQIPTDTPVVDAPVMAEGVRVMYVAAMTATLDAPGGSQVGQLDTGDHPLVVGEGDHYRTSAGQYLPSSALSEGVVGRPRGEGPTWQSEGGY